MNCNFETKIKDNKIYVKKPKELITNEISIYEKIGESDYISNKLENVDCVDNPIFSIISYELMIPSTTYVELFKGSDNKQLLGQYFTDVFDSYMFLISKNVIHNDLKPENVLLKLDKSKFVLSDFDRSLFVADGDMYSHIQEINNDFRRFFFLFGQTFRIINHEILTYSENYQNVNSKLSIIYKKVDKEKVALQNEFETIDQYFEFIQSQIDMIKSYVTKLTGGKKLNKNKKVLNSKTKKHGTNGANYTSYHKNKTKTKLQPNSTTRRKSRCLHRKFRVTRSGKF